MEQNCGKCCIRPIQPHVLNKCHQNVRIDGNRCARNSYDTPEKLSAPNWSGWGNVCVCVCMRCAVLLLPLFSHSFIHFVFSFFFLASFLFRTYFMGGEYISKYLSMLLLILCGIFSHEWLPLLFLIMRIIILHHSSRKCAAHAYNCTLLWRNMEYGTV